MRRARTGRPLPDNRANAHRPCRATRPQQAPQSRQRRSRIRDPTSPARHARGREAHGSRSTCRPRRYSPCRCAPTHETAHSGCDCNILARFPEASEVRSGTPREHAPALDPPHDDGGRRLAPMSASLSSFLDPHSLEPLQLGALRGLHAAVAQVSSPCQTTRAASAPVLRRRRPDGRHARRRFLTTAASSVAMAAAGGIAKPAVSRAADRPVITHGVQSGDVSLDSAIVWARADRPSRMLVEVATSESFKTIRSAVFVDALPESDFTAKALLEGLPAGQDVLYRNLLPGSFVSERA